MSAPVLTVEQVAAWGVEAASDRLGAFDWNGRFVALADSHEALRAERDALRLRVAALEAAIVRAQVQLGSKPQDMLDAAAAMLNAHNMLADDTTALRAMLVEAAQFGFKDGRDYEALSTEAALSWPKHDVWCDAICDRILGASKGGGE